MAKKLLALLVSIMMIMSLFCVIPVSAETVLPGNIGADYEFTDILEGNLFTDEITEGVTQCEAMKDSVQIHENIKLEGESEAIAKGDVSSTTYNTGGGGKMTSLREVLDPWAVYTDADGDGTFTLDNKQVTYKRPLAGIQLQLNKNTDRTKEERMFMTPDYTKNVVVSIPLTMTAGSGNAVVNIARSKYQSDEMGGPNYYTCTGNQASDHEYPIEYNGRNQGVTVAENGRTYLNATFLGSVAESDPQYSYTLGMVMGTDAGITIRMEEDEFYIGYEYAKDLTVEANSTNLLAGAGSITVDADVLNQVGNKGGLSQNVTWYALNEDRTAVVEGITITSGADGTAIVSADSTVGIGTYTLVAVADEDDNLVKGIEITVEDIDLSADYEPADIEGNLFADEKTEGLTQSDAYNGESNVHKNTKLAGESEAIAKGDVGCSSYNTGSGAKITSNREVLDPWSVYTDEDGDGIFTLDDAQKDYTYPLAGVQLKLNSSVENNKYPTPDYTKNVVVRIPLTMTAGSGNAIVNVARSKKNTTGLPSYTHSGKKASDHEYPIEYNGRDQGITVAENGRTYLNATFLGSTAETDPQYSYTLGMVMGTDAGITVRMEEDEFYIGYEYAKDLTVEADSTDLLAGATSIAVDADVLNQVGNKGGLSQNVTWYALNADRTAVVEGITITSGADGKATVSADSTVVPGTYALVAVASENAELIKGIEITVRGADLSADYEPTDVLEGNLFTDEKTEGVTQSDAYNGESNVHKNTKLAGESEAIAKGDVGCSSYNTGSGAKMTSNREVLDPWSVYTDEDGDGIFTLDDAQKDYTYPLAGVQLKLNSSVASNKYPTPDYTKNVVIRIPVTMTAGSGNAIINVARSKKNATGVPSYTHSGKKASDHEYPIEYNGRDQGITVAENGRTYLNATFLGSTAETDPQYSYTLGMVMGTDAGITVRMEEDEFYIGYEYAKDITVEADCTNLIAGAGSIAVDADVLNQVGNKGGLSQNVRWFVLDENRTEIVEGFTIALGADGKATVSADSTVDAGTYTLVAVADENTELVNSITISVVDVDLENDYVAGAPDDNMYSTPEEGDEANVSLVSNGKIVTFSANTIGDLIFSNSAVIGDGVEGTSTHSAFGATVNKNYWNHSELHVNGKQFIIGAQVKAVEGTPKFTAGFYEENRVGDRPDGFGITDGVDVTWTEYAPVCLYMTMTNARSDMQNSSLSIGMPEDPAGTTEVENRVLNMKPGSLFIGYEAAHDIKVSRSGVLSVDSPITVDADVLNQVGTKGTLSQNVTWVAMNNARTEMVEGFTIVEGEDGTATVSIDSTVVSGTYKLVAVADEDSTLVKAVTVKVNGADPVVEGIIMMRADRTVTISTPDALVAKLIVATYRVTSSGKEIMVDTDVIDVNLSAGSTQVYTPDVTYGTKTKAMLWSDLDTKCAPIIDLLEW